MGISCKNLVGGKCFFDSDSSHFDASTGLHMRSLINLLFRDVLPWRYPEQVGSIDILCGAGFHMDELIQCLPTDSCRNSKCW